MINWDHERDSGCKVNLLLNILGKRADGFHELESVMYPIRIFDRLSFGRGGNGIQLSCSAPELPVDRQNLVYRAAEKFLEKASTRDGVRIHLEKNLPLAAGIGGGSANAAQTLLGLNELFKKPLASADLHAIASALGSDIPFFLQDNPALATGRGEQITSLPAFKAMRGAAFILVHPGFGISTPWAYQQLANFPDALNGVRGRAKKLIDTFETGSLAEAGAQFYNSLEAPALKKYPLLVLFQEFFREQGAAATLMSGSGSTTFALAENLVKAQTISENFKLKFGISHWLKVVPA